MNIDDLQGLHGETRQDAWHDDAGEPHMRIRHEDVECHEHARHQHVRYQVYQKAHQRAQQQEIRHVVGYRREEDSDTRSDDQNERKEEKHRQVVGEGAENAARLLHLPDFVERVFHAAHQHQHRVEHEEQTDSQEDAALGVDEVAVDEVNDDVGCLRL